MGGGGGNPLKAVLFAPERQRRTRKRSRAPVLRHRPGWESGRSFLAHGARVVTAS